MKKYIIQIVFFIIIAETFLFAYEVKSVKIIGKTVNINLKRIEKTSGSFSEKGVREIGNKVLEKYRNKGYTAVALVKIVGKDNGVLEIYIRESKIVDVEVDGVDEELTEKLREKILKKENEIYNQNKIYTRIRKCEKVYRINLVNIQTFANEKGDIIVKVFYTAKSKWRFYYSAGMNPASIVAPTLGFFIPFSKAALDINASIGFGEREFRTGEGGFTVYIYRKNLRSAFYVGAHAGYELITWQSKDLDYETVKVVPKFGYQHIFGLVSLDVSIAERIGFVKKYDTFNGNIYDTQLNFVFTLSSRGLLLNPKEGATLRISLTGGWETLNNFGYIISKLYSEYNIFPAKKAQWFSLRPWIDVSYTTSFDRFFWEYVYTNSYVVVFNDLSATKWKNVAGLDILFEAYKNRFFLGPFINAGFYMNENEVWTFSSGMGLKCIVAFNFISLSIIYAWDVEEDPTEGGLIFYLSGQF